MRRFPLKCVGALAVVGWLLASCSGIRAHANYDPETDFGRYTSYAWYDPPAPDVGGLSIELDEELERRLVRRVDEGLERGGLTRAEAIGADLRVRYRVTVEERVQHNDPYYVHDLQTTYEEGSLVIELVDPDTGEPAWRGIASARLNETSSPEKRAERLDKAVDKILDRYPPGG